VPNDEKQYIGKKREKEREVFSLFLLRKNKTSVFVMKQVHHNSLFSFSSLSFSLP
jgi:hypothetical protein